MRSARGEKLQDRLLENPVTYREHVVSIGDIENRYQLHQVTKLLSGTGDVVLRADTNQGRDIDAGDVLA